MIDTGLENYVRCLAEGVLGERLPRLVMHKFFKVDEVEYERFWRQWRDGKGIGNPRQYEATKRRLEHERFSWID